MKPSKYSCTVLDNTVFRIDQFDIICSTAAAAHRTSDSLLAPHDAHASALEHQTTRDATCFFRITIDIPSVTGHAASSAAAASRILPGDSADSSTQRSAGIRGIPEESALRRSLSMHPALCSGRQRRMQSSVSWA